MTETTLPSQHDEPRYRIGAVCRLTGISQHVLRVWEKRYRAVEPERSETRRRLYRESDVNRLSLLKTLVDRGQAIGSIASLDNAELERRIQQSGGLTAPTGIAEKPTLALIGEALAFSHDDCGASEVFDLLGQFGRLEDFEAQRTAARVDVAVIEWPGLYAESALEAARLANRLNVRHLVLVYDYAPRSALARLSGERITALRSPLDLAALEAVVAWRFGLNLQHAESEDIPAGPIPSRRFNDRELAWLAAQSPAIACECPMHLAQLISRLVHFEAYSAECENRNEADALLHAYLHKTTSRARSMMEQALLRVVELENLSLPPDS
jgi:DNA-binding transcriptional MerR regulator